MAFDTPLSLWRRAAEDAGWTIRPIGKGSRFQWLAPDGASIVTTVGDAHQVQAREMANYRRMFARAGLILPAKGEKMPRSSNSPVRVLTSLKADEPEVEEGPEPTPRETARALDAFMDLVTEEMAALREEFEDFVKGSQNSIAELRKAVALLDNAVAKLPPPVSLDGYITAADLHRATEALEAVIKQEVAQSNPLESFRAKMRGRSA